MTNHDQHQLHSAATAMYKPHHPRTQKYVAGKAGRYWQCADSRSVLSRVQADRIDWDAQVFVMQRSDAHLGPA